MPAELVYRLETCRFSEFHAVNLRCENVDFDWENAVRAGTASQ